MVEVEALAEDLIIVGIAVDSFRDEVVIAGTTKEKTIAGFPSAGKRRFVGNAEAASSDRVVSARQVIR